MKIWLGLVFADGEIAATLLAVRPSRWSYAFVALLYPFYIKSEFQLIYVQLNVNDKRDHVAMLQLTIMKHILIMFDNEVQARRSIHDYQGGRLQFGHYDQLIRALRMEDSSSFFNYMRIRPLRNGPRIQKSDTKFRKALEPCLELARTPSVYRKRGRCTKVDYA